MGIVNSHPEMVKYTRDSEFMANGRDPRHRRSSPTYLEMLSLALQLMAAQKRDKSEMLKNVGE